jgi:septal ring factor EnvC (AmiA/AmiB activator)
VLVRLQKSRETCIFMDAMKNRIGVIVLVLICLGLGIALITMKREAARQQTVAEDQILTLSNKVADTTGKFEEQKQVATMLEKDVATQKTAVGELSNNLTQVSASLAKTEASLEVAKKEIVQRDAKIADLETQNQVLDKQAGDLSSAITNLTFKIDDTQKKLAASEGDKAFLEKELKRLITEKADLERQFNDLTVLRAQVAKLKEEISIARRVEWIRMGLFASAEQKGGQRLMQGMTASQTQAKAAPKPNYDLNVEVTADGSVRVIPPLTNAPAGVTTKSPATQ